MGRIAELEGTSNIETSTDVWSAKQSSGSIKSRKRSRGEDESARDIDEDGDRHEARSRSQKQCSQLLESAYIRHSEKIRMLQDKVDILMDDQSMTSSDEQDGRRGSRRALRHIKGDVLSEVKRMIETASAASSIRKSA